ncbi:MAG: CDP-alcohol phosphatidyltransferase family protein [Clostridia bacterium]|nr:CDP-alcohol phosphatidyltransferase family protein [Clostridia bacterium]
MQKKDYFNIPNLMGYFRILMIPVFIVLYLHAETSTEYYVAFGALCVSMITDFFDGKIARKYNMVTSFGKVLDPIADKLTQMAIAIVLAFRYPLMVLFITLFVLKELYMGIMGLYLLKKNILYGAKWYGKIATALIDVGGAALLLFRGISANRAEFIIKVMMTATLFSFFEYLRFHVVILKGKNV